MSDKKEEQTNLPEQSAPSETSQAPGAGDVDKAPERDKAGETVGEKIDSAAPAEQAPEEPSPTVSKPKKSRAEKRREAKQSAKQNGGETSGRAGFFFLLILLIAVGGAGAYGAYWFWDRYHADEQMRASSIDELTQQLQSQQQSLTAIQNSQASVRQDLEAQLAQTQQRLQAAEQRLAAQNKRLLSMSTTSREDWLLAEAEYLLKLANQRVLIERSAEGADALLSEADKILRDLADPDLFPLRQAIANDLAELRLVKEVDVEGIYLALQALEAQVENLPVRPTREQILGESDSLPNAGDTEAEQGWWADFKEHISRFIGDTDRYIRLRDHSEKPRPMLPPDSEQYLQQNLRLILQRAQLALLREQQKIYTDSLRQAREWVTRYYPPSEQAQKFRQQVEELENRQIVRQLPDITQSLELVQGYIDRLHRLDGAKPSEQSDGEQQ